MDLLARQLAALAPEELEREIDRLERATWFEDNPGFWPIHAARHLLSSSAWEPYSIAAYRLYGDRAPPLSQTGILQGPLDRDFAATLLRLLAESPVVQLRHDDFTPGWMADTKRFSMESQNENNIYFAFTPAMRATLAEFLASFATQIEENCGHFWTVGSIRCFALKPGKDGGKHLDGWPRAMKKLFLLPNGVGRERGSTYFKLRTGAEVIPESAEPTWIIFENSVVQHCTIVPRERPRPTIEIDLLPAFATDPTPVFAGINGWYPWFPGIELDPAIYRHALKRAVALAGGTIAMNYPEDVAEYALPMMAPPPVTAPVPMPEQPPRRAGVVRAVRWLKRRAGVATR